MLAGGKERLCPLSLAWLRLPRIAGAPILLSMGRECGYTIRKTEEKLKTLIPPRTIGNKSCPLKSQSLIKRDYHNFTPTGAFHHQHPLDPERVWGCVQGSERWIGL